MTKTIKFHGVPGTGKTSRTIEEFKKESFAGTSHKNILYSTYRVDAANDGRQRIAEAIEVKADDLRYVRTEHGICLSLIVQEGLVHFDKNPNKSPLMQKADYNKFNKKYGYSINSERIAKYDSEIEAPVFLNDPYLSFYSVAKSTRTPFKNVNSAIFDNIISPDQFVQFAEDFEEFKADIGKIDFFDMPELVLKHKLTPDCSVQIYDEAQDMYKQLFDVAKLWSKGADKVFLAGDPLQTIYTWAGADPRNFLDWEGELEILKESHRLPANIWKIASDLIARETPYRVPPDIKTKSTDGYVNHMQIEHLQYWLSTHPKSADSTVFHLVRTNRIGYRVACILADVGIPFKGIAEYAWKPSELQLYNAFVKSRTTDKINIGEYESIVNAYPLKLIGNKRGYSKKEIQNSVEGSKTTSITDFSPALTAILKSKNPLANSEVTGLSLRKLQGAISANLPIITPATCESVKLLTFHGSKGLEADTVFLHNGLVPLISRAMHTPQGREYEAYCWYVALTRTRRNLIVIQYTGNSYPIPGVCA